MRFTKSTRWSSDVKEIGVEVGSSEVRARLGTARVGFEAVVAGLGSGSRATVCACRRENRRLVRPFCWPGWLGILG